MNNRLRFAGSKRAVQHASRPDAFLDRHLQDLPRGRQGHLHEKDGQSMQITSHFKPYNKKRVICVCSFSILWFFLSIYS